MNPKPEQAGPADGLYVTADLPGTGGFIKQRAEDFLVEEQPLYEPCGSGEHLYLFVQKKNLSHHEAVEALASHFGVRRDAVGFAGQKDKTAITRQVFSIQVPGKGVDDFPPLQREGLEVLWADMHTNKLRRGHLKGNRFSIRIRGVQASDVLKAHRVILRLEKSGAGNRFGPQRFGMLLNNHVLGAALVRRDDEAFLRELLGPSAEFPHLNTEARLAYAEGRYQDALALMPRGAKAEKTVLRHLAQGRAPRRAITSLDFATLSFYISALQSWVFNRVLDARLTDGTWTRILPGDLAFKHDNGAVFACGEAEAADPEIAARLARMEISPSGPMWGAGMMRAAGAVAALEEGALARAGLTVEVMEAFTRARPELGAGARRSLRMPVSNVSVEGGVDEHGAYVRCAFDLPRGGFATEVLREVTKNDDMLRRADGQPDAQAGEAGREDAQD